VTRSAPRFDLACVASQVRTRVPDEARSCESRQVLGVVGLADDLESSVIDGESA